MLETTANMDQSNLMALPLEIREMVYDLLFEGDFFYISLTPLQLCGTMRAEAHHVLTRKHKTAFMNSRNDSSSALTALNHHQQRALAYRINAIPPQLRSNRLTFELQHDCRVVSPMLSNHTTPVSSAQFTRDTRNLVTMVSPCKGVISVDFIFHSLSAHPSTHSYHSANQTRLWDVCQHGEPMTSQECEHVVFKITATDKVQAQKMVDEVFAEKSRQLEAHRAHKVCFMRLGVDKALASLTTARDMMTEMANLL